ncbi:hypothetical protein ACHQM5_014322 [Ranunculus cassubicifolius]
MSAQQAYRAGETQGHAEQTADQWMQATKDKASSAHDMACDAANSAQQSAQHGQQQAAGFMQQTGEKMSNMAHEAMEGVKNTLGVGEHSHKK